jgi:WD40 repeat protein
MLYTSCFVWIYADRHWIKKGHTDSVLGLRFEGKILATCSKDHTVKLWSMETGELLHNLTGHAAAV